MPTALTEINGWIHRNELTNFLNEHLYPLLLIFNTLLPNLSFTLPGLGKFSITMLPISVLIINHSTNLFDTNRVQQ